MTDANISMVYTDYYIYILFTLAIGHGPMIMGTGLATVTEYIHHRTIREQQIVVCLMHYTASKRHDTQANVSSSSQRYVSSWEIVNHIYCANSNPSGSSENKGNTRTIPKPTSLPFAIKLSAQNNVLKHLAKLQQERVVRKYSNLYFPLDIDLWCIVE